MKNKETYGLWNWTCLQDKIDGKQIIVGNLREQSDDRFFQN